MLLEEENKRIHIAQGLPWTTDEPEVCFTNLLADWEIATYECSYCFLMAVAYQENRHSVKLLLQILPKFLFNCEGISIVCISIKKSNVLIFSSFQCLVKPTIKERTEPIDLVLHSDIRALERAEFDQHVRLFKFILHSTLSEV